MSRGRPVQENLYIRLWQSSLAPLGPFDQPERLRVVVISESERPEVAGVGQPIEIEVDDMPGIALVGLEYAIRRTFDRSRFAERLKHAAHERRLASAEVTPQKNAQ
jgi:hypothetical protein